MLRAALAGAATLLLVLVAALTTGTTGSAPSRGQVASASPQVDAAVPKAPDPLPSATVTATPPKLVPSPARVAAVVPQPVSAPVVRSVTSNSGVAPIRSLASTDLPAGLLCIRGPWNGNPGESNANYRAVSPYGDGGGYQYAPRTWGGFGGYPRAELAPPAVQDARALADYLMGTAMRHMLWPNTSRRCGV